MPHPITDKSACRAASALGRMQASYELAQAAGVRTILPKRIGPFS